MDRRSRDRRSPAERYEFVSVDILMLSVRAENALLNANIDTIGRLIRLTENELEAITGISTQAIGQLKARLAERNLWLVQHKRKPTKEPVKEPPPRPVLVLPPPAPPPLLRHEPRTQPVVRPAAAPAEPAPKPVPKPPPAPPAWVRGNYERGSSAFVTETRESWFYAGGRFVLMNNDEIQKYLEQEGKRIRDRNKPPDQLTENATG